MTTEPFLTYEYFQAIHRLGQGERFYYQYFYPYEEGRKGVVFHAEVMIDPNQGPLGNPVSFPIE